MTVRFASRIVPLVLTAAAGLAFGAGHAEGDERADFFERSVRPLLVEKCWQCHGDAEAEGGLRLSSRAAALKGGNTGPAAVVGKAEASLLVKAARRVGDLKMPPDERLTDAQIGTLSKWINDGMAWPDAPVSASARAGEMVVTASDREHWAFRPLVDPPLPQVARADWPNSPVDRFVLAKLEAAGLEPSPPADRRTLLRRASYDLIGLPPTWAETQGFVNDPRPTDEAYAEAVDRWLASPRYAERWGRLWLDIARFADTKDGVLMYGDDRVRPYAYTYRDYVLKAFDEDLPFDRFVHEQLAADLIEPKVEPWRLAALGFLTLGRMYDNNVHDVIDDQIDTTTRGFLGLTVSCARCHDHKYDPVPMADYYSLYGIFASAESPLEPPRIDGSAEPSAGVAEFEKQAAPKRDELRKFLDEQFDLLSETARKRTGDYLTHVATTAPDPLETAIFFLSLAPEDLRPPIVARWRRLIATRSNADDPVFGLWHDLMALSDATAAATPDSTSPSSFAARAAEVVARWKAKPAGTAPGHCNPLILEALAKAAGDGKLENRAAVARVYGDLIGRLSDEAKSGATTGATTNEAKSDSAAVDAARGQFLALIVGPASPGWFPKSQTRRYMSRQQTDAFGSKLQELDRMAVKSPHAPPRAMAVFDAPVPHDPKIFLRGNPSQPGRSVPRQMLAIAQPGERAPFQQGSGRLELAKAITSSANPLTARVLVNRVWMHHFGEPLVATPSDFGRRTAPPTHPELLDHLAARFMADGWSLKRLHRRLVLSNTYRQASDMAPGGRAAAVDPENRLLSRMRRRRLDFEQMRDSLLAHSGRIQYRFGGRPVEIAADPNSVVRTVYGLVDRQSLPGVFRAFDFASPDVSTERRPRTMVPQQALFALNSPFMRTQAEALAARAEVAGPSEPNVRVAALYRIVLHREPDADETAAAVDFLATPNDAATQLARLAQLAQVLLGCNEAMYVD